MAMTKSPAVLVSTTFSLEGFEIVEYKGVVRGLTVRSPTIGQGVRGGFKSIIGGQIKAYTEMCEEARQQAYSLLLDHAVAMGANAVVGMHYDTSDLGNQATEVLCYGTAVVVRPLKGS